MRIVFLGTNGPLSGAALAATAQGHEVVAVARPAARKTGLRLLLARALGRGRTGTLDAAAREAGVRVMELGHRNDPALRALLEEARPDLLCVASFPWLLGPEILSLPRMGAVNVHAALLPRHRGPLPLFWIYHGDDRETGVSVHWMTARADAGDLILQSAFALPRGLPVDELNRRNAEAAGPLLARALAAIAAGDAPRTAQDESRATTAPFVRPRTPMVAFDTWGAERIWHFMAGLHPRFIEPLTDERGEPVRYRAVRGFTTGSHQRAPGTVERGRGGATLFCRDGTVQLDT